MQALHIRSVPDDVVAALKRRAEANHRSLQGELVALLEEAARRSPPPTPPPALRLHLSESPGSTWTREDLYEDADR
jgi:hypothetical protein